VKEFVNWSTFDIIMIKSQVYCFFDSQCISYLCIIRPHCLHAVHLNGMQPLATGVACSVVCLFVCLLGTRMSCGKTTELINVSFEG